jgi:hypothetical protein
MANHDNSILSAIRKSHVYQLTPGGVLTDLHLAAFMQTPSRRRVVDQLIHPIDHDGIPCVAVGYRYLVRVDALAAYLAEHERPQECSKTRGGTVAKCHAEKPPCKKSA